MTCVLDAPNIAELPASFLDCGPDITAALVTWPWPAMPVELHVRPAWVDAAEWLEAERLIDERRRLQWLLGRHAARCVLRARGMSDRISIRTRDAAGRGTPPVVWIAGRRSPLHLSIAHADGTAVAAVSAAPLGVDWVPSHIEHAQRLADAEARIKLEHAQRTSELAPRVSAGSLTSPTGPHDAQAPADAAEIPCLRMGLVRTDDPAGYLAVVVEQHA